MTTTKTENQFRVFAFEPSIMVISVNENVENGAETEREKNN